MAVWFELAWLISAAISSISWTPNASAMRFCEPNALIKTGICFANDIFKEQRGPAAFHHAIRDLGDFQFCLDRIDYALKFAGLLQGANEAI